VPVADVRVVVNEVVAAFALSAAHAEQMNLSSCLSADVSWAASAKTLGVDVHTN